MTAGRQSRERSPGANDRSRRVASSLAAQNALAILFVLVRSGSGSGSSSGSDSGTTVDAVAVRGSSKSSKGSSQSSASSARADSGAGVEVAVSSRPCGSYGAGLGGSTGGGAASGCTGTGPERRAMITAPMPTKAAQRFTRSQKSHNMRRRKPPTSFELSTTSTSRAISQAPWRRKRPSTMLVTGPRSRQPKRPSLHRASACAAPR